MELKTQNRMPNPEWSFGEVFGLVAVAVLVCAAIAVYWSYEEDLPRLSWGVALLFGIMAGIMGIALALRAHYGKGSLRGSSFMALPAALFFVFLSTTHPHRGSTGSIAFAIISYALGLSVGIAMGVLTSRIEEKHITYGRLIRPTSGNARDNVLVLAGFAAAIAFFFTLDALYPGPNGMQFFAGFFLGMVFCRFVWICMYEKRNNIRVTIEL